jgi:ABC-type transport system involved in cytochrome c biogenesis permease subunit
MTLATVALILIAAAAVVEAIFAFRRDGRVDPVSSWLLATAAIILFVIIAARSLAIGFFAVTGTFESLVFFSGTVAAVTAGYRLQKRLAFSPFVAFGATIVAAALLAVASSPIAPRNIQAPVPALRSSWLALHVSFAFIGEAFFVVAFAASIAFLATKNDAKRETLDRITYTAIAIGYPIFTAGALVFGPIWAQAAWGSWWSWDPKETWALVTWLVFTLYLHLRLVRKRRDALPSIIAVLGFLCALFTFLGVNFLLSGLHSYA